MENEKCALYEFEWTKSDEVSADEFRRTREALIEELKLIPLADCVGVSRIHITRLYPEAAARYDPSLRVMFFEPDESNSLLHEVGHFIWRKLTDNNRDVINKEWSSIMKSVPKEWVDSDNEKILDFFFDFNSVKNANEFFADSYRAYNQKKNLKLMPETKKILDNRYHSIKKVVEEVENNVLDIDISELQPIPEIPEKEEDD